MRPGHTRGSGRRAGPGGEPGRSRLEQVAADARQATGDLAELAESAAAQAAAVLRNGRRAVGKALSGRIRGQLRRALGELAVTLGRTVTVVAQAWSRLAGQMPNGATRLVSLHDPDARPIRKGRIDRPVEFGYKAQVLDNGDGIVVDYTVEYGAVPDGPQLVPAIRRVARRTGHVPSTVTADRGYGQVAVERDLHAAGVRTVAIPRQATTSAARKAIEHRPRASASWSNWRTGCKGRISYLKHRCGWDRTRLDSRNGNGDLVRARGIRPQPSQDRGTRQLTRARQTPAPAKDSVHPQDSDFSRSK